MTIKEAAAHLRAGEVVAFPTETVYGLGANAFDAAAVKRIYDLKGRPPTSPLIVHVNSIEMAQTVVKEWPPLAEQLARQFWPGPLTFVLPKQPTIPDVVTAGLPTVGVRVPNHPIALELIRETGLPLAAPSANKFTGISPTTAQHVLEAFGDQVPVIDGGACAVGLESTVVSIDGTQLTLLRPGMLSLGDLGSASATDGEAHPAPGMHHRHYSPRTPLLLIDHPSQLPSPLGAYVWHTRPGLAVRSVQLRNEPSDYAAQLYATLHELDRAGLPWIAVEAPPATPAWSAIRDRLERAQSKVE